MNREEEYRFLRKEIGTIEVVSEKLGISISALSKRERGDSPIKKENMFAMLYLYTEKKKLAEEVSERIKAQPGRVWYD